MGVEALDTSYDEIGETDSEIIQSIGVHQVNTDARRRLENKMEELRLMRELKEFDFDD